jgi:hypothetical protein
MNPDTRNRADQYWWRRYLAEANARTMMYELVTTDRVNALANQIATFAKRRGDEIIPEDATAEAWDRLYVDNFDEWVAAADKVIGILLDTIVANVAAGDVVTVAGWIKVWRGGSLRMRFDYSRRNHAHAFAPNPDSKRIWHRLLWL